MASKTAEAATNPSQCSIDMTIASCDLQLCSLPLRGGLGWGVSHSSLAARSSVACYPPTLTLPLKEGGNPVLQIALDQPLGDLHGIEGRTLAQIVGHHP